MRKMIAFMLALCLAVGIVPACAETASAPKTHTIEKKDVPLYVMEAGNPASAPLPLYFLDGVKDLPYVELGDLAKIVYGINADENTNQGYELTYKWDGPVASLVRENGFSMTVDFEKNIITFPDYEAFGQRTSDTLISRLNVSKFDENGQARLLQINKAESYQRNGEVLELDLNDYDIPTVWQDGLYLVPLQTLSDFLLSPSSVFILYNGENAFLTNADALSGDDGLTPLGELYYSVTPVGERSKELSEYGYSELCLVLDYMYGLKDSHDIQNTSRLFWQVGYDGLLRGTDARAADQALSEYVMYHLDDMHSGYLLNSWMTGKEDIDVEPSQTLIHRAVIRKRYQEASEQYNLAPYQEIGDTAYITLTEFRIKNATDDYYTKNFDELTPDTITTVIYAHQRINREDSPIRNVVLDLSNSGGGAVDAAAFILGWFLGDAELSFRNTMTGAIATTVFRADVNLDMVYDEKDTVSDKNLYCLISPVSFSCANMLPAAFKESDIVTLLGRTSGGGACIVGTLSTAWGSVIQISSPYQMSFTKNGSFYNSEQGVEPQVFIKDPAHFYEREGLTDFIHKIY